MEIKQIVSGCFDFCLIQFEEKTHKAVHGAH